MAHHLPKSIERQQCRLGSPLIVRRTVGDLDFVTSERTVTAALQVQTKGVLRRRVQRNVQGDAISTEEFFYLVPSPPFDGQFVPQDADLIVDGAVESRVTSVRTRQRNGRPVAYELHVSGPPLTSAVGAA